MSFDWREYIKLSEELLDGSNTEAKIRTSISRAYYGAFCLCRIHVGETMIRNDIHKRVQDKLKESDEPLDITIGNTLGTLFLARKDADYESHVRFTSQEAKKHLGQAKTITKLLAEIQDSK
jgi:uncharacterized protein (UPF0332 family)